MGWVLAAFHVVCVSVRGKLEIYTDFGDRELKTPHGTETRTAREETPANELALRNGLMHALARTVYLGDLTITDIAKRVPSWRSSDLANVRSEKSSEFGTT